MVIYLAGSDTVRSTQILSEMKEKFITDRDPQQLNVVEYSVTADSGSELIHELHVSPFLAEKRMVILKRLCSLGSKELHASLLLYIEEGKIPGDTIVIVWDEDPKPKAKDSKRLVELLTSQPYSKHFDVPTGKALDTWISARVQMVGGTIETAAVHGITQCTTDIRLISHMVDQLVAYAAGRQITATDVALFAPLRIEDNIFELVDSAIAGNAHRAFTLLREQYRAGKDAHYVFAMLLRQYRIMLDVADVYHRGRTPDAKDMGLHPFVLKKTLSAVTQVSYASICKQYQSLLNIDTKIKTGAGDMETYIDVFVGSI